jgi:hypothetical protein
MFTRVVLVTILAVLTVVPTRSQERFSFFAASSPESVERMLTLARLNDDDVVVDLGSGNGLIPPYGRAHEPAATRPWGRNQFESS